MTKNSTNFNETDITKGQHDLTKYLHSSSAFHFPLFKIAHYLKISFFQLRNFIHSLLIFGSCLQHLKKHSMKTITTLTNLVNKIQHITGKMSLGETSVSQMTLSTMAFRILALSITTMSTRINKMRHSA